MEHDSRCDGLDDEKVISDVAEYGWHVVIIPDSGETPGWAFSIGLYKNFNHPEIVVFGLDDELIYFVINSVGEGVRRGKSFAVDGMYPDLIDAYICTFKPVSQVWYYDFLGYANWFYKGENYPALQCIWLVFVLSNRSYVIQSTEKKVLAPRPQWWHFAFRRVT